MLTPFRTVILSFFVCLASVLALPGLRVDMFPKKQSAELNIYYTFPNGSPDVVEQQATAPLENLFSQLTQLNTIESRSHYNRGHIQLVFDPEADMEIKKFEVSSLIRQAYPKFNSSISYPIIETNQTKDNEEKSPLLVYTIRGSGSTYELKRETENVLQNPLARIPGIRELQVTGSKDRQITVAFDRSRLLSYGLTTEAILEDIVQQVHSYYPGTVAVSDGKQLFIKICEKELSLKSIEEFVVKPSDSLSILVKNVAEVFIEEQEPMKHFRINGKNAINLSIFAHEGENAIRVAKEVKELLLSLSSKLPSGIEVQLEFDNTEFLEKELNKNYWRTGFAVIILVVFILLSYRSWRYLTILFFSLIVNVAITILFAWYFQINIHLYSLAGVAISFGVMIDNAVVMLDYYHQYRNRKVFLALLGATLTTISALLLVFLLPEEERTNLTDFVLIMTVALGASLVSSLIFTPGFYNLIFGRKLEFIKIRAKSSKISLRRSVRILKLYHTSIQWLVSYRKIFIAAVILLFGVPVFMLPGKWEGHDWYNNSLGSDVYIEKIKPFVDKALGGSLRVFIRNVYERDTYRDPEKTRLYVIAQLPFGNTLDQMNYILENVEQYLSAVEGIDKYVTQIPSGQYGSVEITFDEAYENGTLPYQLKSKLIARSLDWGGIDWNIYGVGQGFTNALSDEILNFKVLMKGYNYDELDKQAARLAQKLLEHQRVQKVNVNERLSYSEKPSLEYVLQMNSINLSLVGGTPSRVFGQLHTISKPTGISTYVTLDGILYPLILKEKNANDFSKWNLMNDALALDKGNVVKLNTLSELQLQKISSSITKEDRQYLRVVGFDYYGTKQFGEKYLTKILDEMEKEMPIGYSAEMQSRRWDIEKLKRQYSLIVLLLFANFIICSILFESLLKPFLIIATVPVAFIGLLLTFGLLNVYFDQGGYAAFVMLGGLVLNSAIFIVNDFNNKLVKGRSFNQRLVKTICNRGRTIFITTISSCCGMIPFLVEGQNEVFWFALGAGTIGGLLMSMFAIFVVLPVLMFRKIDIEKDTADVFVTKRYQY